MANASKSSSITPAPPADIGGYTVVKSLSAGTWLAMMGTRRVTLKTLDPDCLMGRQLHPNIKERLGRVRELAHPGVANLHSVERDEEQAFLIWEYIEGSAFEQYAADPDCSPGELLDLAREVILVVESLHGLGIVHGALHGRNVIVDAAGTIHLTHISPLLYDEAREDAAAVLGLLRDIVDRRREPDSPLAEALVRWDDRTDSLRQWSARLAAMRDPRPVSPTGHNPVDDAGGLRRRAIATALAAALAAGGIAYAVTRYAHDKAPMPQPLDAAPAAAQK